LESFIENLHKKSKKNRRCNLHSLESQKQKSINDWLPVWDAFSSTESRQRAITIDSAQLLATLDSYLRKHRFCSDCKLKVVRAFHLLTGELDSTKEKGYCAALYEGLECCTEQVHEENQSHSSGKWRPHVHVLDDKHFVAQLISKAEPEIYESKRERHAKTLDIAQEEVLTCVGIYLYERFHRIYQAMKLEEQTWQLLFYTAVITFKKCFEVR
jgi:hypothetical protein